MALTGLKEYIIQTRGSIPNNFTLMFTVVSNSGNEQQFWSFTTANSFNEWIKFMAKNDGSQSRKMIIRVGSNG